MFMCSADDLLRTSALGFSTRIDIFLLRSSPVNLGCLEIRVYQIEGRRVLEIRMGFRGESAARGEGGAKSVLALS